MAIEPKTREHFADLDGIRGVLACLVMLMHYGLDRMIKIASFGLLERCEWELSVDFFFVLSGFVLAQSFELKQLSLATYFVKRYFRLAPMFLLSLGIITLCGVSSDRWTTITNVLIVQSLVGLDSINYPSWSIPFELFLPAFGVLAVRRWKTYTAIRTSIVCLALLVCAMAFAYALAIGSDHRIARACLGLGLGLGLYRLRTLGLDPWRSSSVAVGVTFTSILVIMLTAHQFPLTSLLFHPLVMLMIMVSAAGRSVFSGRVCQALGRWSYSIYLLHIPVLAFAAIVLGPEAIAHNPVLKLVFASATIALSATCHRYVERPMMRLSSTLRELSLRKSHVTSSSP